MVDLAMAEAYDGDILTYGEIIAKIGLPEDVQSIDLVNALMHYENNPKIQALHGVERIQFIASSAAALGELMRGGPKG